MSAIVVTPIADLQTQAAHAYGVGALLRYVQHRANCNWLQLMWHKGPCDCGLTELIASLPESLRAVLVEASEHARATVEEMKKEPVP